MYRLIVFLLAGITLQGAPVPAAAKAAVDSLSVVPFTPAPSRPTSHDGAMHSEQHVARVPEGAQSAKTDSGLAGRHAIRQLDASRAQGESAGVSLSSIVAEVVANNPGLKAARRRAEASRALIPAATAWEDLQVGVEFFAIPIGSANPFAEGGENDIFVQQMIPFPGKTRLMGKAAEAGARMADESAAGLELELAAEAGRAVAMLYSAQRRAQVNEESLVLMQQIIESARAKYSVGRATQGDVLKAQVELARLQNEGAAIRQEQASALAMVNALRSEPVGAPVGRISELSPEKILAALETLVEKSQESRPEIRGMQSEIQMNASELEAAKREKMPDFMVRGMYKQMIGMDQVDQWALMVAANVPIAPWARGKYSARIGAAEANLRASEESLRDMRRMVESQVSDAYAKAVSRWDQIERYVHTILPQATQSFDANLAAYRTDQSDFLTLLDDYRLLKMTRMEYFMALGDYYGIKADLQRAVGDEIR